jgi:chromosome partitioning protein
VAYLETAVTRLTPINRLKPEAKVNVIDRHLDRASTSAHITQRAEALSARLRAVGERAFPPTAQKSLRSFSSGEVADIVDVSDGYLRQLSLDGLGPTPEVGNAGRRSYTLEQINELRQYLATARPKEAAKFWPRRRDGEKLQIITVANFKGGSAKTTTSLYLAQGLALQGFRVLAIDLDPQASLSAMFGYQPEFDVAENTTLYGTIRYDDQRVSMKDVIRPTYFTGISIVPGNLELMEFEHQTPRYMLQHRGRPEDLFFRRVAAVIQEVEADFDVVVIDCPPQLGFLTMGALNAATGMIVTVHPQMVDVASMSQFLLMTSDLVSVIEDAGGKLNYDFLRFLVTRHDPRDVPEQEIVGLLRDVFSTDVMAASAWKSTAIANAGLTKQSLFELARGAVGRSVYDRAMESINAVNNEAIELIYQVWGRQ